MSSLGLTNYKPLLDQFTAMLRQKYGGDLISVVLYGSVARGTACPESDVDLLVVIRGLPERYGDRLDAVLPLLQRLREEAPYRELVGQGIYPCLSLILYTAEEADQNRLLYLDMIEDSVRLVDEEGFFGKRLKTLRLRLAELGAVRTPDNGGWYWDLRPDLKPGEVLVL